MADLHRILVIHGPNLNLLGTREPEVYGSTTLAEIDAALAAAAKEQAAELACFQSNHEGELIDCVHRTEQQSIEFIIFNPAAFTHTSIALRDALLAVAIPFIEVHLSNPLERESFRHTSYFSDIAEQVISGHGAESYTLAAEAAINYLNK